MFLWFQNFWKPSAFSLEFQMFFSITRTRTILSHSRPKQFWKQNTSQFSVIRNLKNTRYLAEAISSKASSRIPTKFLMKLWLWNSYQIFQKSACQKNFRAVLYYILYHFILQLFYSEFCQWMQIDVEFFKNFNQNQTWISVKILTKTPTRISTKIPTIVPTRVPTRIPTRIPFEKAAVDVYYGYPLVRNRGVLEHEPFPFLFLSCPFWERKSKTLILVAK